MATSSPPPLEPLAPEAAARLAEFAKSCRAATRVVSMYPPSHPTIKLALSRITDAGQQAAAHGPLVITVLPDSLLVDGRGFAKPDPAATELAVLLHQQWIGELTLHGPLDGDQWHAFLSLLARPVEDTRALGGIARAWATTGHPAISLKEIDYAEVLRERGGKGDAASWERILATLGNQHGGGAGLAGVLELAQDPGELAQFAERLQAHGRALGDDATQQRRSLLELMHGLANYAAERQPETLEPLLARMAGAAAQMPPEMLLTLITDPPPMPVPGATTPRMDLASELQARLTDEMLAKFVVDNVVNDRGASHRLAAAFQTLVPDAGRQRALLATATEQAATLFGEDPQFESVWNSSTEMLTTYSDSQFVSDDYARELTSARTQATAVERTGNDPPARIRAWLATVSGEEVRALDQRLLLDLLTIEVRPDAWSGVLDQAIGSIEQLVLVGDLSLAAQLVEAIVNVSRETSPFAQAAAAGLARLADGSLVRHLTLFLRQASEAEVSLAAQICRTIGPALVGPLADALAAEDNARTVRRLRDILIDYGTAARQYADELRRSPSPAVRRAAIDLLRALGGEAALPDLRGLLDDAEPQVQREALRAIVQIGTQDAYEVLEQALRHGQPHTREAIVHSLGSLRDERAAPLFVHILTHTGYTGALEGIYTSTIESLGRVAADERSVTTLRAILHRGQWYAPGRTSRLRAAAARALRAIALPSAERALREAAAEGSGGVKRAARAALADAPPARPSSRRSS